jgi:spermidine/putrescine transport system substrate-binding protein
MSRYPGDGGIPLLSRRNVVALAAAGTAALALPPGMRRARAASDLLVFDWTGYDVPELHQEYITKYGASPEIAVYGDVQDAFTKIQAGFLCDTVHPNIWDMHRFFEAGLLQPWDTSKLRHWADIFPSITDVPGARYDNQQYLIPTDWGLNLLIVRSDIVDFEKVEESWNILWDKQFAGRISMNVGMEASVKTAALTLGDPAPYHMTDDQVAAVRARLTEQRELVRFYWSDPTELVQAMASGEIVAAYAWQQVFSELVKAGHPVVMARPKEGMHSWLTGFARLASAPGKEQNAYDYVDAWLAPESGKWMIENYGYGHSNRKAFDLVAPELLEEKGLTSPADILANSHAPEEFDPALREKLIAMFEQVKAGF